MKKLISSLRHAWAWIWQTCGTCAYRDCVSDCAECYICRHGKPRWIYDAGKR